MRNIRLVIEYDGTGFAGWQTQPRKRTVQETIEQVLRKITQERVHLIGASRTDAGVHALGQTANFQTRSRISCDKLLIALNGLLPPDVAIKEIRPAPTFHANKDARRKTYRYLIWNASVRNALMRNRAWHVWTPLNLTAMRKGAGHLLGRHDFSAFRGTRSDTKTSVRTIYQIKIGRSKGSPLQITVTGNGFLKYMVRNIVGTFVEVGKGRLQPEDIRRILRSKDRKKAGATAPAFGLYLVKVRY